MSNVAADFLQQADACAALGSPFTARLLRFLVAEIGHPGAVMTRIRTWPGDPGRLGDVVALRLAGGLHALALGGLDTDLAAAYREPDAPDHRLHTAVLQALARHEAFLLHWLQSPPQTNEVRRSAALIAAGHWLTARFGLPLRLSELGASAGLNLLWDRYALMIGERRFGPSDAVLDLRPDWQGDAPPEAAPVIAERAGVDLNPLDPVADRLRLMAYIWADQADRLARTDVALSLAAELRPALTRGDAVDWLATRLARPAPGALHVVCHTIAWQYFSAERQARGAQVLAEAGARATTEAPLAHLAMEADETPDGAALTLRLWPGDLTIPLGRVDFHGRWLRWLGPKP